jgi:hypothetical protein
MTISKQSTSSKSLRPLKRILNSWPLSSPPPRKPQLNNNKARPPQIRVKLQRLLQTQTNSPLLSRILNLWQ